MSLGGVMTMIDDTWETPYAMIHWLDSSFDFTVDLCASDQNRLCEKYYTKENSCLNYDWKGERCFLNPPFGPPLPQILHKCLATWHDGDCCIVAVLPAKTDTNWFHDYVLFNSTSLTFIRGRVKFDKGGKPVEGSGNPAGNMIVVWKSEKEILVKPSQIVTSVSWKEIVSKYG